MAVTEFPFIPENITVHLGPPDSDAPNVTVPFPEYIKNVASSELYPTWPVSALRANILAIISFALNRVYTEWYRNKGYDFDITSSTAYDQKYTPDKEIYANIGEIVNEIFNSYIRRKGTIGPIFAAFCDGKIVTCDGLTQWGSVELANQGMNSFEILQHFFGDDIEIVSNVPVTQNIVSYPGTPLQVGDYGNDVATIQIMLNRISKNYPALPKLDVDGVFGPLTEEAVKVFQRIFNIPVTGIVDSATWYRINYIFVSVKRLSELTSEGLLYEEYDRPFERELDIGSTGVEVYSVQYYLNLLSNVYSGIDETEITGTYDENTKTSVRQFQERFGLKPTGVVDMPTFRKMVEEYNDIVQNLEPEVREQYPYLFGGEVLTLGATGEDVTKVQTYLSEIAKNFDFVPQIQVTNVYDDATVNAVKAIQERFVIPITGTVGPVTWYQIVQLYKQTLNP